VSAIVATSAVNQRRLHRARVWLESRAPTEEVLIIGASLDAANELARRIAEEKGAVFGWQRLTLPRLAAPLLSERKLAPLSPLGTEAVMARVVHRAKTESSLGRYEPIGNTPRFSQPVAAVMAELRLATQSPAAISAVAANLELRIKSNFTNQV
jgi:hypothetical protein